MHDNIFHVGYWCNFRHIWFKLLIYFFAFMQKSLQLKHIIYSKDTQTIQIICYDYNCIERTRVIKYRQTENRLLFFRLFFFYRRTHMVYRTNFLWIYVTPEWFIGKIKRVFLNSIQNFFLQKNKQRWRSIWTFEWRNICIFA